MKTNYELQIKKFIICNLWCLLKTKKSEADKSEKAELPMDNQDLRTQPGEGIQSFVEVPLSFAFSFCLLLPAFCSFSQSKEKEIIAISAGAGVLAFYGDVGKHSLVNIYNSSLRSGYSFSAEKYFNDSKWKSFSFSLSFLKGKIAGDDKTSDHLPKLNFESPITQIGIKGTFFVAGKRKLPVIPFFSAGFSFLHFDPHGDLRDKNGNYYYYWKDGSIRNLPETPYNFYAQTIERDYNYETKLNDTAKYSLNTFAIPLEAGIKIKLTPYTDINLGFTYHFAFSSELDNVKSSANDKYLLSSVSLTWHIYKLPKKEREDASQLFTEIDKMDSDKDGVADTDDLCPGTPEGVKVDGKGCPMDNDADGVPDYLDKEPHSKGGLPVDADGVELTKERLMQLQKESALHKEAEPRSNIFSEQFNKRPSTAFLKAIEEMRLELRKDSTQKYSGIEIPFDLRIADWDKDGFISSDEIAKTIDAFFEGRITFSAEQINRLIDFFFEQ